MSSSVVNTLLRNVTPTTGEGPFWLENSSELLFVDILSASVYKYDYGTSSLTDQFKFPDREFASVIVPTTNADTCYVGSGRDILEFEWSTKKYKTIFSVDADRQTRLNDGKVDRAGRFWFGTMGLEVIPAVVEKAQGSLFFFDGKTVSKESSEFDISNGLDWTADNRTMLFADSIPRVIFAFDYDFSSGHLTNKRVVIDFNKHPKSEILGLPDGMCLDAAGHLWIACYDSASVFCFDVEKQAILETIKFPCRGITSCCFGGPHLNQLFVTSTQVNANDNKGADPENYRGSLFRVDGLQAHGLTMTKATPVKA